MITVQQMAIMHCSLLLSSRILAFLAVRPPHAILIVGFYVSKERRREESTMKILASLDGAVEATAGCPHTQLYNKNDKGIPEPGISHPSPLGLASLYSSSPKPPISTEECTPIGKTLEGIASSDRSFIYGVRADESKIILVYQLQDRVSKYDEINASVVVWEGGESGKDHRSNERVLEKHCTEEPRCPIEVDNKAKSQRPR